ncbi:hypothetical protein B0H12DRAFT_1126742 [Mycena haematopus]|nr:hypothetical protein B0H12DRAFT_1126742 [Mycena haematopus]
MAPRSWSLSLASVLLPIASHSLTTDPEKSTHAQQHPHVAEHEQAIDEHIQNHPVRLLATAST